MEGIRAAGDFSCSCSKVHKILYRPDLVEHLSLCNCCLLCVHTERRIVMVALRIVPINRAFLFPPDILVCIPNGSGCAFFRGGRGYLNIDDGYTFRDIVVTGQKVSYLLKARATRALEYRMGDFGSFSLNVPVVLWEEIWNQLLFLLSL